MDYSYLGRNADRVRSAIADAARAAGRSPDEITLLAATKYAGADEINYLHRSCGIHDIGENRVQSLIEKWDALDREGLRIHFIGSLQTNKVKYIADKVCMIHSLDSDRVIDVLVEINSGREESKGGVLPEDAGELAMSLSAYPNICLRGFMTMAPAGLDYEEQRKYFGETYDLIVDIWHRKLHNIKRPIISMGMSDSFAAAIAEGAGCVRIGRALFERG